MATATLIGVDPLPATPVAPEDLLLAVMDQATKRLERVRLKPDATIAAEAMAVVAIFARVVAEARARRAGP